MFNNVEQPNIVYNFVGESGSIVRVWWELEYPDDYWCHFHVL